MAGKMKNCPICGKLFVASGMVRVCMNCQQKEKEITDEVVAYVREHPKCKIAEIVQETRGTETMIKRLIKEGRFEQVGVKLTYPCEKCGAPILMGKLCSKCSDALRMELKATQVKGVAVHNPASGGSKTRGMYSKGGLA